MEVELDAPPKEGNSSELFKLGRARDDDVGMVGTKAFGPLPNDGKLSLLRSGALVELYDEYDMVDMGVPD